MCYNKGKRDVKIEADMASRWIFVSLLMLLSLQGLSGQVSQSSDIYCLQEFKNSVSDPNQNLATWTFSNLSSDTICQQYTGVQCLHPSQISVYSLSLQDMGLGGTFPQGLENCTSLTTLELSSNSFAGPIPSDLGQQLPFLVKLDLSMNSLGGGIPHSLSNCTFLNSLHLQKNRLTGSIPGEIGLLGRLNDVNFADNQLSGQIPYTFHNYSANDFQGNSGLCGFPLPTNCKSSGSSGGVNAGIVVGVVAGVVAALVVAAVCVWFLVLRKKRKRILLSNENAWIKKLKAPRSIPVSMFEPLLVKMRLSDLMAATDNFSRDNLISAGQTGVFYKATLQDGSILAIKRLRPSAHSEKEFRAEMATLGKLRHRNLVPLLGYCIAGDERLLVYKHMINGTLQKRLHESSESETLDWPTRLHIGIGAARGLAWLHHSCNPCIIHRNISSSSILLGEDFDARITDFGLARLMNPVDTHVSTRVNGDFGDTGYVAPEYARTLVATVKGDVYSFGVVLLELVTGQKPLDVDGGFKGTLVEWVGTLSSNGTIKMAIDKSILSESLENEQIQVLRVGCACILPQPKERPTMYEVYQLLRAIGEKYHFTDQDEELAILSETIDVNTDELIVSRGNGSTN